MKKIINNKNIGRIAFMFGIITLSMRNVLFAAADPLESISTLSNIIFQIISIVGGISLAFGLFNFGMSFKTHDASQRDQGLLGLIGGIIMVSVEPLVNLLRGN